MLRTPTRAISVTTAPSRAVGAKCTARWASPSQTMSLNDFGGGYDPDTANPEDEANQTLSQWLARQSNTRVYWDRDRSYGHGTFSVTTHPHRPDLVVTSDGGNYAVEVKQGTETSAIYDAAEQAMGYWSEIVQGNAEYSVNNETIDIDAVVIATDRSPEGHIFANNRNLDPRRSGRGSESDVAGKQYPQVEHAASQAYVRVMYRWARSEVDDTDTTPDTGIGALYSSALDGRGSGVHDTVPAAFYLIPENGRYTQNWSYIPYWKQDNE